MPDWVQTGCQDYQKRIQAMPDFDFDLTEIAAQKRGKNAPIARLTRQECAALLAVCPNDTFKVALDVDGKRLSSERLAAQVESLKDRSVSLALFIGGPEGFDDAFRAKMDARWSLSDLTLPHPIARVVITEAVYRAITILHNHPYHRG